MRQKARDNAALVILIGGLLLLAGILVLLKGIDRVQSPETPLEELGGRVGKKAYVGMSKNRYYGQAIVLKFPKQVSDIEPQDSAPDSDRLIFAFPGGQGALNSHPADATATLQDQQYQGTKHPLKIAGRKGFYIFKRTHGYATLLAGGNVGPQQVTIQLSSSGGRGSLVKLARQLGSNLKLRKIAE